MSFVQNVAHKIKEIAPRKQPDIFEQMGKKTLQQSQRIRFITSICLVAVTKGGM